MREFFVWQTMDQDGTITKYYVSDVTDKEAETQKRIGKQIRPDIAVFPVSAAFPVEVQHRHAIMFKDYINKIEAAKQQAIEQTALVDLISAGAPIQPKDLDDKES